MYGPIVFSAYKSSGGEIGSGNYLAGFDKFLENQGNVFTLSNGIFTTQRSGTYEFSVTASVYDGEGVLSVVKNGLDFTPDLNVLSFSTYYNYETLSFSWIMELKQKDIIRLKVTAGSFDCGWMDGDGCIFNGKFIRGG